MFKLKGLAAAATAASLLMLAAPSFAADGVVAINQSKALNGNVTAGDTPGFPVTISEPGHYKLTSDLVVSAGKTGVEVTSDRVVIDLNGFAIHPPSLDAPGARTRGVIAIAQVPATLRYLTVMNGMTKHFQSGIQAPGAFTVIDNVTVTDNTKNGIEVGNYSRVTRSTAEANGWSGIVLGTNSIASQNIVADNASAIVDGAGIRCLERCLIERNVVTQADQGFGIIARTGGMVIGNVIAANKALGLVADGGPVGFTDNTLTANNNNGAGQQVTGELLRVDPNACKPTSALCP